MADKSISELVAATSVGSTDLFVLQQANTAKKLTGQILENWLVELADGHGGIQTITKTGTSGLVDTYTITLADLTTQTFTVTNGKAIQTITDYWAVSTSNTTAPTSWQTTMQTMTTTNKYLWHYQNIAFNNSTSYDTTKTVVGVYGDTGNAWYMHIKYSAVQPTRDADMGDIPDNYIGIYSGTSSTAPTTYTSYAWYKYKGETGATGNGISSIAKTSTSGLVDTYTVTFTNGTTTTFTVTNGSSIQSISKTGTVGLVDTYTVTLTNGNTSTFTVTNAKSISSINKTGGTGAPGTRDTYTISFNDGTTTSFQVYNGANGTGAVSTVDGIQPTGGDVSLLLTGDGAPTTATVGQTKQRYFDYTNNILYVCMGTSGGTYVWHKAGVSVDAALSDSSPNPVQNAVVTSAISQHTSQITATQGMISDAWNGSTTYTIGQYCIYNNALYRCKVQHTNQRPPNSTYWDAVSVSSEIATIGNSYSASWICESSTAVNTRLTNNITLPVGKYLIQIFAPISTDSSSKFYASLVASGGTVLSPKYAYLDSTYGTQIYIVNITSNNATVYAASGGSGAIAWQSQYLDRGGITAIKIK